MATPIAKRRRLVIAHTTLFVILCSQVSGVALAAESPSAPDAEGPLIANVWVDVPLREVLRDVSMQAGVTIAVGPSVPDELVSLEAKEIPLQQCLQKVTAGQGLEIHRIEEGLYVVGSANPGTPSFAQFAESRRVSLKYITSGHLTRCLPRDLQSYVSSGERKTEVVIFATPGKMKRVLEIIEQIDIPRRQVVLAVLVVELSQEADREFGLDWERSGPDTLLSLKNLTGTVRYTSIKERDFRTLAMTLNMLIRDGSATVRSRPRVATLNGEQATIDVSLEEYFTIVTDASGTNLRTRLQVVKSGVVLKMTPQIGDDGDITVSVSTEVSDVATRRNNDEDNGIAGTLPIIRRRKAQTRVRVKDGDAIVIGGLIESQKREEVRRVPILGSIPLLCVLFRSTREIEVQKEVLIFIAPRLILSGESPLSERHNLWDVEKELKELQNDSQPSQFNNTDAVVK